MAASNDIVPACAGVNRVILETLMVGADTWSISDLVKRPAWMQRAACRRVGIDFFATKGQKLGPAKAVCGTCVVRSQCLDYGLEHDDGKGYGIWGGLSPLERQGLKRQRAEPS